MQARCLGRLKKESEEINRDYKGVLELNIKDDTYCLWHIRITGAEGSVY